jgi:TrmH family RNA methyltransferase
MKAQGGSRTPGEGRERISKGRKRMEHRIAKPLRAQLKRWRKLTLEKYRRREGRFLAEGVKVIDELLRSNRPLEALLVREGRADRWEGLLAQAPPGIGVFELAVRDWEALSQDPTPEGVMAVAVTPPPADLGCLTDGPLLLLNGVNNPNNLGALLRTADWFGFHTVLIGAGSVEAHHPKAVRTSMGSLFHVTVSEGVDFATLLPTLRERFQVVGSGANRGIPPHPCPAATALLLGSESHGLPEELLAMTDEQWRIPGGGAESLSLPQAAAILMYECTRGM